MTQLANEASSAAVVPNPPVAGEPANPVQRWLGYVNPVVNRVTGAMSMTQSAIEKRLGFCPGKEALKVASNGLDALAEGLHGLAQRLRALAAAAPQPVESSDDQGSAQARA